MPSITGPLSEDLSPSKLAQEDGIWTPNRLKHHHFSLLDCCFPWWKRLASKIADSLLVALKKLRCMRKVVIFLIHSTTAQCQELVTKLAPPKKRTSYLFYTFCCLHSLNFAIWNHKTSIAGHYAFGQHCFQWGWVNISMQYIAAEGWHIGV